MEVKKVLSNNRGSGFPFAVAITLCLVMIFTGISEYLRLMIVAQGVRDALQEAVISTVSDNYDDVYHGVREGYSGGYKPIDSEFVEYVDYGNIYDTMDTVLGLSKIDDYHVKITDEGEFEFRVSNLDVDIRNTALAGGDQEESRFKVDSSVVLEVPVSFGGRMLPLMKIQVKNSAGYTPKF